ncbi:MAG: acetate--CoA ligase family protein [Promethearchaeota archaeon]
MIQGIKDLFEPASVAIIGASSNSDKIGNEILRNILEGGFNGKVFPINPNYTEILGLKTYPSIIDVPESVDLAVIVIPSKFVTKTIEDCSRKSVKSAVIVTSGFREIGEEGRELEQSLIDVGKNAGIRIVGPNSQGIINTHSGLLTTFGGFTSRTGSIGVISQSGSVSGGFQSLADKEGIGISKLVNLGNKADINELDLIQYFKNDDKTKVIALYLEGLTDGKEFMKVSRDVVRKKPIIILKGGRTKAGMKASASHTGSLAGNSEIFAAAIRQTGVIMADTFEELYDFAKIFAFLSPLKGPGIFIIESSGGAGTLAADTSDKLGLKLPRPNEEAIKRLKEVLPPLCVFSNPFDLGTAAFNPEAFKKVINENMSNNEIHAFLTIFADPILGVEKILNQDSTKTEKPIIVVYFGGFDIETKERKKLHSMEIPVFPSCERGIRAINALIKYSQFLDDFKGKN